MTTIKLHQLLSTVSDTKSHADQALTHAHRELAKAALLTGISRVYTPLDDEGESLPSESTRVQLSAAKTIEDVAAVLTNLFDTQATLEATNASPAARADVVVNGETIFTDATVPFLLTLTKRLTDVRTFITNLPTLDAANNWTVDETEGVYKSETTQTTRTKKTPRSFEKSPSTDKHPAQVELYYEDSIVGTWATTKFSGALPIARVRLLTARIDTLIQAVKIAREEANGAPIVATNVGQQIMGYLFA